LSGAVRPLAAVVLAVAMAAAGCEWLFGVDELSDKKCPAGQKPCEGEGECVNISSDTGCGREGCAPCTFLHGFARCNDQSNECELLSCQEGYLDCDPEIPGCETDIAHTADHCGGCSVLPCTAPPYAIAGCSAMMCTTGGCMSGHTDCDEDLDKSQGNGCETPVESKDLCPPTDAQSL
jgi:hypothetical protein